jgi:hypothetical protein
MARFNFNVVRKIASTRDSVAWGQSNFEQNSTLVFAALLIVCSLAIGCSSEKPKTEGSTNQSPISQMTPPAAVPSVSAPATPAPPTAAKPVHKKAVRRVPATVTYADKTSGVSFQYPRKYALKTGESASQLVSEGSVPMGFAQPGGVAVAAVSVPEGAYPKSDLASAYFDVSVNKSLTAEQCGSFPAAQTSNAMPADGTTPTGTTPVAATPAAAPPSKLMIGEMELQSSETIASVGSHKEASKYYHVFENGACYEFALKVATTGETDEGGKSVDRDEVFKRLEKILATVKISPAKTAEVTASVPAAATPTAAVATPAQ